MSYWDLLTSLSLFLAGLIGGVLLPDYKIKRRSSSVLFLLFLAAFIFFYNQGVRENVKLKANSPVFTGIISPGNESIPKEALSNIPRSPKQGQTVILLGNNMAVISNNCHNGILKKGYSSFFSVDINLSGLITFSMTILYR